jgi:hypothetical protein
MLTTVVHTAISKVKETSFMLSVKSEEFSENLTLFTFLYVLPPLYRRNLILQVVGAVTYGLSSYKSLAQ